MSVGLMPGRWPDREAAPSSACPLAAITLISEIVAPTYCRLVSRLLVTERDLAGRGKSLASSTHLLGQPSCGSTVRGCPPPTRLFTPSRRCWPKNKLDRNHLIS